MSISSRLAFHQIVKIKKIKLIHITLILKLINDSMTHVKHCFENICVAKIKNIMT